MKKMIIGMVAVMLGLVANAAAVSWSVTNIQGPTGADVKEGWLVQVFDSSVTYSYEDALAGNITAKFTGATSENNGTYRATQKEADAAKAGDTVNLYLVIYDADSVANANNYIVSEVNGKTVNTMGSDISIAFGSMKGTTAANKFLNSSWTATPPIPEPTSGLLLLVGGALLALRRKRK